MNNGMHIAYFVVESVDLLSILQDRLTTNQSFLVLERNQKF